MRKFPLLIGLLTVITAYAAPTPPTAILEPLRLTERSVDSRANWDYALDGQDTVWTVYYAEENVLYVRRPGGSHIALLPEDHQHVLSGLALEAAKHDLSLLWREKLPNRGLYYQPSIGLDGRPQAPVLVDSDSKPLARFKLAKQKDATYFLWYGERGDPESKQQYHIYFSYSEDNGKTFSRAQQVLPGIYPAWIVDEDVIPVFTWSKIDNRQVIAMRSFDLKDKIFGPMVEITEAPPTISPYFHAFKSADRWFLMWIGHYGDDLSDLLFEGVYSDDKGQTWKRFAFEDISGLDILGIDLATDDKNRIFITLSGSGRLRDQNKDAKNDVYLIQSHDNGTTWSKAKHMRPAEIRHTHGQFPSITFGPEQVVMVVWEDWRGIRPNVYVNYSSDNGNTWREQAIPLGLPGFANLGLDHKIKTLSNRNGQFYLVAKRYTDDSFKTHDLVLYQFTLDQLKNHASEYVSEIDSTHATESKLRERTTAYWQAMVEEDYDVSYTLLDPFFQANWVNLQYKGMMGRIKYHSYEVGKIALQGNVAKVLMTVEVSVPEFKVHGETVSRPKKSISFIDTWVFVGDHWYREFYSEAADVRFTRY